MKKRRYGTRSVIVFKQFSNKSWSLFAALGKEILIGVLAVPTLTYAKADGIATRPLPSDIDSLSFGEQLLDDVVVTGSRAPLTAGQSAKIVEVISRDDIHRAGAQTVNDVLKLATGVDVRQRGGFGVQTDISINGGTFDQITILLNGVPLGSPQTGHNAADFPVSLDDIDHIEVLEGASARVFGSSAFSGAINIVTRPAPQTEARVTAQGGSFGTFGGDATVAWAPSGHMSHQLSGGYTQSDGGTANSSFRKRRGFYQGHMQSATASLDLQGGITSQDYGANTFYSARFPDQFEWTRRYIASARGTLQPWAHADGALSTLVITPTLYGHRDYDHYQLTRGQTGVQAGENYHRMDVYGASADVRLGWAAGTTVLGADVRKEHILSTAYGELLPEAEQKRVKGTDRTYARRGDRTNTSLFLEHDVVWHGLTVSAGLMANRNTGLDGDFRFYPGIDVSWRPDGHWKLYASWNKALRLPTFTDLYTSNAAQRGDTGLKPERNSAFTLGARWRTEGLDVTARAFYSRGRNMIDWVYESEEATQYQALNIGKLDNMGMEVQARWQMAQTFPALQSLRPQLQVGYAYIHQKHETDRPIYKSLYALEYLRHKLTAQLSHRVVSRLSAQWSLRWQQRMNGYHPYAKLDCKLMWTAPRYTLFLTADNLTCHRYYDLSAVRQPGLWVMAGASLHIGGRP